MAHLPNTMQAGYQASLDSTDLLSLTNELALVDSTIVGLLDRLKAGDVPPPKWADALVGFRVLEEANQRPATTEAERQAKTVLIFQAVTNHRNLLDRGASFAEAWEALADAIALRTKVAGVEGRRRQQHLEYVERRQFGLFVRAVLNAVAVQINAVVTDASEQRRVKALIQADVLRILQITMTQQQEPS